MQTSVTYQNWCNGKNDFLAAVGTTALVVFIVLTVLADFWVGVLGGLTTIVVMNIAYNPFKRTAVYKFFLTTWPVAAQIVENVTGQRAALSPSCG